MKRKMDGGKLGGDSTGAVQKFDETVKTLGNKLKEGNTLDVGQRGCNKVSAMAEQLRHKFVSPILDQQDTSAQKQAVCP
jgi:hypothetical protein